MIGCHIASLSHCHTKKMVGFALLNPPYNAQHYPSRVSASAPGEGGAVPAKAWWSKAMLLITA
jgi:hypothetical protein